MINSQFKELNVEEHSDIIDFFNNRLEKFALPIDIRFFFQSNSKQKKQLIKISKIPDHFVEKMQADLIVQINLEYYDAFSTNNDPEIDVENMNEILFDQEIDKITVNTKNSKISLKSNSIKASPGIIEKFNYEDVVRAEEIEALYEQQKANKE